MKEQLAEVAEKKKKKKSDVELEPSKPGGTLSSYDKRPAALVRKYGELYAQTRLETLESLDKLKELNNHDDLKSKLLFSVIVLSFRSVSGTVETKRDQVRRILQLPPAASNSSQDGATRELEAAITAYLRRATETFDLSKNVEVSRLYYSVSVVRVVVLGNCSTVPVLISCLLIHSLHYTVSGNNMEERFTIPPHQPSLSIKC